MENNKAVLCLVQISTSRIGYRSENYKIPDREKEIQNKIKTLFPEINFLYTGLSQNYNLNQNFGEVKTHLATSFDIMDFVDLSLEDSLYINNLYLNKEIDIFVNYLETDKTGKLSYQPHTSFPDNIDSFTFKEYPTKRYEDFEAKVTNFYEYNVPLI